MVGAPGAVVYKEKKAVRALREGGAVSPESARNLSELDIRQGLAFRILQRRGIVRETDDGRFYLDEQRWNAHDQRRRRLAVAIIAIVMVFVAVLLLVGTHH